MAAAGGPARRALAYGPWRTWSNRITNHASPRSIIRVVAIDAGVLEPHRNGKNHFEAIQLLVDPGRGAGL
jgi:hypothetical protein